MNMEISLIERNSSSQDSYSNKSNVDNYMLMPEKHLSYFYDIANVGRKTGKRRKSVEKDSDGMDNISDFFGEDESESDDPDDKDDFNNFDEFDELTDGIDDSTIINENIEENEISTKDDEQKDTNLIQNNKKIKDNNKEISMSLEEAAERLQKIINETPSKSKIDMTPVLNSVLKASKLNNENESLYSYETLQEAKSNTNSSNEINNQENLNSITHDKIYEYDEDIKGESESSDNEKDVFETESSSDDEFIINVNNKKRKSSNNFELQNKYGISDTETELDLRYSSNSESDDAYEYESGDSGEVTYYLNDNKNKNKDKNHELSPNLEYQNIQSLSSKKKQSRRKSERLLITGDNNKRFLTNFVENDIVDQNQNLQNEYEDMSSNSTSEMSIARESTYSIAQVAQNKYEKNSNLKNKSVILDINNINQNKNPIENSINSISKEEIANKEVENQNLDLPNENNNSEIFKTFSSVNKNINSISNEMINNDNDNNVVDNYDVDIPNDFTNYNQNDLLDNELPVDINNIEENLSDKSDKENINDKEINIQINIPILKQKSKRKGKSASSTSSNKRKRNDDDEGVQLRKSSRKRIPPCKYWEGERPEDLLILNEEQIKERQLKREKEEEEKNQWTRKKKRTKKTIKKEDENEKPRPVVKMVNATTSPIKGLNDLNEIDYSMSNSRDYRTEITVFDVKTNKIVKQKLVATQKMLEPQPVNNSTYKFTRIFSEDLTYATGLLLFPKGSFKPNRNSKDNILFFFVMTGEISVQIHKTTFNAYAGDHFMIPRGNQYMIKNIKDKESKIWFIQFKVRNEYNKDVSKNVNNTDNDSNNNNINNNDKNSDNNNNNNNDNNNDNNNNNNNDKNNNSNNKNRNKSK
ncbi:hypothetical protein BCR36DRAFT_402857, partial [Piromyces finnis]